MKEDIRDSKEVLDAQDDIQTLLSDYLDEQQDQIVSQVTDLYNPDDEEADYLDKIDYSLPEKRVSSFLDKMTAAMLVISKLSSQNAMDSLKIDSETLSDEDKATIVEDTSTEYARFRSAELIGKKILDDGSIIDNPNASYCINDTTRAGCERLINDAMDNGLTNDELAKNLSDSYDFSDERASMIARTETNMADNNVSVDTFKGAGIEKKAWLTAQDDLVSDECVANEKQGPIGIDEDFESGDSAPPAHPNCRCTILAVFDNYKEDN